MHPIQHLKKLLNTSSTNQGRIISSTATAFVLATPKGSMSVIRSPNDVTVYKTGDTVLLANGVVVGRRLREPTTYVI